MRKEIVNSIALCATTLSSIIERQRDIDCNVRLAAFKKCTIFSPKVLKIIDRQRVMMNGIAETDKAVLKIFESNLLPKWLNYYDDDLITLLCALKLDASDEDNKQTAFIHEKILKIFFE